MGNLVKFETEDMPSGLSEVYFRITDTSEQRNNLFTGKLPVGGNSIELDIGTAGSDGQGVIVYGDNYSAGNESTFKSFAGYGVVEGGLDYLYMATHENVVFEGDSITAGSSGPSHILFDTLYAGGAGNLPVGYNHGVGGRSAVEMATKTAEINALNPSVVVFHGGTNDLSVNYTAVDIFNAIKFCRDEYVAGGAKRVIILKILPRSGSAALSVLKEEIRVEVNSMLGGLADSNTKIVDLESAFNPVTMCVDGLHPNAIGANLIGKNIGPLIHEYFGFVDMSQLTTTQTNVLHTLSANPAMSGTTGSKSNTVGDVATGWSAESNVPNVVAAKIDNGDGTYSQSLSISGTATSGNITRLTKNLSVTNNAGDKQAYMIKFKLLSGHSGVTNISCGSGGKITQTVSNISVLNGEELSGFLRVPAAEYSSTSTSSYLQTVLTFATGSVSATMILSNPILVDID